MPDPRWTGPPEQIALIFEAGSAASVVANNLVWVTETANKELSTGLSAVNALATATQWQEFAGQEFGGYVGRVATLKAMS